MTSYRKLAKPRRLKAVAWRSHQLEVVGLVGYQGEGQTSTSLACLVMSDAGCCASAWAASHVSVCREEETSLELGEGRRALAGCSGRLQVSSVCLLLSGILRTVNAARQRKSSLTSRLSCVWPPFGGQRESSDDDACGPKWTSLSNAIALSPTQVVSWDLLPHKPGTTWLSTFPSPFEHPFSTKRKRSNTSDNGPGSPTQNEEIDCLSTVYHRGTWLCPSRLFLHSLTRP